jgi:hypothetical protein
MRMTHVNCFVSLLNIEMKFVEEQAITFAAGLMLGDGFLML